MNLYDKIFKPKTMRLANGKAVEERASRLPVILLVLVAASVISVKVTGFNLSTLLTRGNQFFVILGQMFPPNASYLSSIWTPLFDTIKMSLLGSFIGSALAIPFAIVASTNIIHNRAVIGVVRVFLSLVLHPAHPGYRPDRHLYVRPGHHGGYLCHCGIHLCLCGQAAL